MLQTGSNTDDSTYEQTQTVISGPYVLEESGKFIIMKKIDDEICERAIRFILMHNAHHGNKLKNLTIVGMPFFIASLAVLIVGSTPKHLIFRNEAYQKIIVV